jgi:hypothetical protein
MAVMAVFDFHGDSGDLAERYNRVLRKVVAISPGRPIVHLAVPREYGFMVVDVWDTEGAFRTFEQNPDFRRVMAEVGLPEPKVRLYPVHNLGWPVDVMPLYR